jgi:hypothetical protein
MKKKIILFLILIVCLSNFHSIAQTFGNEWINYNQTYFKFKVAKDSIYRISISTLTALGLPSTVEGANLQLVRDGQEVPLFVSSNSVLNATDYVEFFGEKANGKLDALLYQNPNLQLNPDINLVSDTAYYFLTYNASTNNQRYNFRANNIVNPPLKEDYFWNKIKINYRTEFSAGKSSDEGGQTNPALYNLNSSQYEEEGYVKRFTVNKDSIILTCINPYKIAGGPSASFKSTIVGKNFFTNHQMKIFANNNLIADSSYISFDIKRFNLTVPMGYLNAQNKITFRYEPLLNSNDRFGISFIDFRYPSVFNFENKPFYFFELEPKLTNYYLEITNFNSGGVSPKLYDINANEYIIGDISSPGIVKFVIPSSSTLKKLVLINQATFLPPTVIGLEKITFKNYTLPTNQGDYIMLTHKGYTDDGNGNDYVNDYKTYRESVNGGAYQVALAFTSDIYNEFGYGYDYSSLALKNFLNYAKNNANWAIQPKQVFIIGKGINYYDYLKYKTAAFSLYPFYAIPSFGQPCSDLLLTDFTNSNKPEISIGRLSAFNAIDIKIYLDKVKDYESEMNNYTNQTSLNKLWQKRILHIAGTKNLVEQLPIIGSLERQRNIIESPYYGGKTILIKKGSTSSVETINSNLIDQTLKDGVGLIQFFGHSSSSTLDYNLDLPEKLTNYKKYFTLIANGCAAGNIFETTGQKLLSERYVLVPNAGAIAFIASVNTGFSATLGTYTDSLYAHYANNSYGKTIGEQLQKNVFNFMNNVSYSGNSLFRMHCQQILINGDPAIKIYHFPKPDYAIEEEGVKFKQTNLTSTIDSIDVELLLHNLGKYTTDSVSLLIKQVLPNNAEIVVLSKKYPGISNTDTLKIKIPTYGKAGLGRNSLSIELDQEALIEEISESNNTIKRYYEINNDDLVPVYPYEFSIVNAQGVTLKASTLNPFAETKSYIFQIDTTEKFNSAILISTQMQSKGGVIKWQPVISLRDSTVYYWRTAMDTLPQFRKWTTSSFIYLNQSSAGWNQSHYYQFKKNNFTDIYLDTLDRKFKFIGTNKTIGVQNACMNGPSPFNYIWDQYFVKIDGSTIYTFGCDPFPGYSSLQFMVIDTLTGQPWINKRPNTALPIGRFGSFDPCRVGDQNANVDPFFEFSFATAVQNGITIQAPEWRKRIMDFIDSIPKGYYVMMQPRLCVGNGCGGGNKVFVNNWKADTTLYGSNVSLYHKLKNLGFDKIDSLYKNRSMIMWVEKDKPATAIQYVGADSTVKLYADFNFKSTLYTGNITSAKIGPSKEWTEFKQIKNSIDPNLGDTTYYQIYGITLLGTENLLATVQHDTSLSFINAQQYPYLKIVMNNSDNIFKTAEQLNYWRVLYQPQPEAAINPNRYFVFKDSLSQGETSLISIAIENLTTIPMDSMLVKYSIIDENNQKNVLGYKRFKPLSILDTIIAQYELKTNLITGNHTLEVDVNPDNDQLEQYHPNNIGLKSFYVTADKKNPLIDVTFDGIRILDRDIVSAKPFINITLKDENKYLALDDTSLVSVYLRKNASGSFVDELIPYDNQRLKFIPATLNSTKNSNQARIEFRPEFTKDDDYMLILKNVKDKSGNSLGVNDYKVAFSVQTKSSISSLLNYPNPFTTSTQFLFTLTGYQIPSQLKIQILTPTGKVVREITKAELGNIHIGRNLTEFKWNGDDQFGQPLANGVYLYRLVSNLNGEEIDHFNTGADKFIEKGFGKLYIMR